MLRPELQIPGPALASISNPGEQCHTARSITLHYYILLDYTALQHIVPHIIAAHRTAVHFNALQCTATYCSAVQCRDPPVLLSWDRDGASSDVRGRVLAVTCGR